MGVWAALAWATPLAAADLVGVAPVAVVVAGPGTVAVRATPLEGVRETYPRIGRNVLANLNGAAVPTIEWRNPVEVRVRTFSGISLSEGERAGVRALADECLRGAPRLVSERTETNGTFVVRYDCVWLQGYETGRRALILQ
jgi:hypothetical protein